MSTDTVLGMIMFAVMMLVLVIYFVCRMMKDKKTKQKNIIDFRKNAMEVSEHINPEVKGYGLALARFAYDAKTTSAKMGKEMAKGIAKGVALGALTGRARVNVNTPNAGCDFYVVRFGNEKIHFYDIGPRVNCQNMLTAEELSFSYDTSNLADINVFGNKVTFIDRDNNSFTFDLQMEERNTCLSLKEETTACKNFINNLKTKL